MAIRAASPVLHDTRTKDIEAYVSSVPMEIEAAEAAPASEVTSKQRRTVQPEP